MAKCSPRDLKGRSTLTPEAGKLPVFSLSPMRLELAPGQSAAMVLEGSCDIPTVRRHYGGTATPSIIFIAGRVCLSCLL